MTNQAKGSQKYDVAISFLARDVAIAQALYEQLSAGLEVFFFPRNQEELAGTDGLESMREPFVNQSRINLVIYREQWGNTPWTSVEADAVKDSCLANAYRNLFFFVAEPTNVKPPWVPDTQVRFNYSDFTLEQAVGAIKLRVQERGGHYTPLTPLKRAEILKAEDDYRRAKSHMNSGEGLALIQRKVSELFQEIEIQCVAVNASGHVQIRYETTFKERSSHQSCILTDDQVGMIILWHQQYSNTLDNSQFSVREFIGGLILNSELDRKMYFDQPQLVGETKYEPELSRSREYGWKKKMDHRPDFITSSSLAEKCVIQFLDLVERYNSGRTTRRY